MLLLAISDDAQLSNDLINVRCNMWYFGYDIQVRKKRATPTIRAGRLCSKDQVDDD